MLDHETTIELIALAKTGDDRAKERLIMENEPLIKSLIKRFRNKGVDYDDLYQLACVGIMKAINNFDVKFEVRFSTYAVPMILGEVKRFMRDDGTVKVSRSLKVLSYKIVRYIDEYKKQFDGEPSITKIAEEFKVTENDVVFALDAGRQPVSLSARSDEDNKASTLFDKLSDGKKTDDMLNEIILKDAIAKLPPRERKIIMLRYFRDKTQTEIAREFGLSQVQISRLESKIIEKLKQSF